MTAIPQHMVALEHAQHVRLAGAELKRTIAAMPTDDGLEFVARLLEHPTDTVGALKVGRLIMSIHKIGEDKALTLIHEIGARSLDRKVRKLTDRQRLELALLLRARGWRPGVVEFRQWKRDRGIAA